MKCCDCKEEKLITEFYRDTSRTKGCVSYCKTCYEVRRKKRINPETEKARVNRYNKRHNYKIQKMMRIKYPEKYKARWALQYAVRSGKVIKPKFCSSCGVEGKIQGHHHDYSKPLDVIWLCKKCHEKV